MKILVTGTVGFIGFHLARKLLERGDEVVWLDNINDYYDVNLKYSRLKELGIVQADVSELIENFGYKPNTSLDQGIVNFVQWYKTFYAKS